MTSFISALDTHKQQKQMGENGHFEYGWANKQHQLILSQQDKEALVTQYFYQLVRTKDTIDLENQLHFMLSTFTFKEDCKILLMLYKMIAQTRDIIAGKGEYNLSFMQLAVWNQYYPTLAMEAFKLFVLSEKNPLSHQYGSWKDIKYMCEYLGIYSECYPDLYMFTNTFCSKIISFAVKELKAAWKNFQDNPNKTPDLIGRWLPREKSKKFGWIHEKIAEEMFPEFCRSPMNGWKPGQQRKARIKQKIHLTKILVALSKATDTPQIKFCEQSGAWHKLSFNNVTSITLRKQKNAILNKDKSGEQRSNKEDRILCANNYRTHIEKVMNGDKTVRIHGKRCNVGELVKDALTAGVRCFPQQDTINTINLQWESNKSNNKGLQDKPIIAMCDTSGSMEADDGTPLYNAMGLSLRVSELCHPAFRDRIMTFSAKPTWVKFNKTHPQTFVDKVLTLREANWGCNTDFHAALDKIIEVLVTNNIEPKIVRDMVLAVFSDMQYDAEYHNVRIFDSASESIARKFSEAGLKTKWKKPYEMPHVLFWNLRKTNGFPATTFTKNITFLSGYSSSLLNIFCEKGIEALRQTTPITMLENLLNNSRYEPMKKNFLECCL